MNWDGPSHEELMSFDEQERFALEQEEEDEAHSDS